MLPKGKDMQGPYTVSNPAGCRFEGNSNILKLMTLARPGDKIFIEDIKAVGPDKLPRPLSPILLSLN
jgi:hypothetical protein